ncbi:MAG: prephenate dehydratase [Blastocatellia bacterium]|nr:prephenate dehydratase [Blastocatellia bacterium]
MNSIKVAYQGEIGAYSEIAAARIGTPVHFPSFAQVFKAIVEGLVDCGALPIENSLGGAIYENYDLIFKHPVEIVAETFVCVEHCLMGLPGASLETANQVLSHPQALAQCSKFLNEYPKIAIVPTYDTAGSAKMIKQSGEKDKLAIASENAAKFYGLEIIRRHIATHQDNFTRFLIVAKKGIDKKLLGIKLSEDKTSIVFALQHETGSLFHALSVFALRKINLTKIESRPSGERPFEYLFYVDYLRPETKIERRALDHLAEISTLIETLGQYGCIGERAY